MVGRFFFKESALLDDGKEGLKKVTGVNRVCDWPDWGFGAGMES